MRRRDLRTARVLARFAHSRGGGQPSDLPGKNAGMSRLYPDHAHGLAGVTTMYIEPGLFSRCPGDPFDDLAGDHDLNPFPGPFPR